MYAGVLLPLALDGPFHYRVPNEMFGGIAVGVRVLVSFGSKRFYTGIVAFLCEAAPAGVKESKPILQVLDDRPLIGPNDLAFHQWLASYYLCSRGEVLRTALPTALLPESRTMVYPIPDFEAKTVLPDSDSALLDILASHRGNAVTINELRRQFGRAAIPSFTRLLEAGAIRLSEEIVSGYKPRARRLLSLAEPLQQEEALNEQLDRIKRAKQQTNILSDFLLLCEESPEGYAAALPYEAVTAGDPNKEAAVRALRKRGILVVQTQEVSRINGGEDAPPTCPIEGDAIALSSPVSVYYGQDIEQKEQALERLIRDEYDRGGQILLLTPGGARQPSAQGLTDRLSAVYREHCFDYSSSVSEAIRVETFRRVSSSEDPLIVQGSRSALFLPFRRLSLIIVDEEHEYGYKQQAPAPRFHARDAAVYLGFIRGAKVLLTSECPSSETLYNIATGKWARIQESMSNSPVPILTQAEVIDTTKLRRQRQMKGNEIISPPLSEAIEATLKAGRRVLLIQNRRGYAPYIVCTDCGAKIRCPHCDVSLTYHKHNARLICHYCGYNHPMPRICPSCRSTEAHTLSPVGYGVERVEEEVALRFPRARTIRIDADVALSKKRMTELYARIEQGDVDIIIGTQMIKGQPIWDNIGLIGMLRLDSILAFPDFRSEERAFQLLFQLALRASSSPPTTGRDMQQTAPTRLLIQTADPEQPFIEQLHTGRYDTFIEQQMHHRDFCRWPPYRRITTVVVRATDPVLVEQTAAQLAQLLRGALPQQEVSPVFTPEIERIDLHYIRHIVVRRPLSMGHIGEREQIRHCLQALYADFPASRRSRISFDVDPL